MEPEIASEKPQPRRSRRWMKAVGALVLAIVLYVLSVGPAYYLAAKCRTVIEMNTDVSLFAMLGVIYRPLEWLAEGPPMRKPFLAYMRWWLKGVENIDVDEE